MVTQLQEIREHVSQQTVTDDINEWPRHSTRRALAEFNHGLPGTGTRYFNADGGRQGFRKVIKASFTHQCWILSRQPVTTCHGNR